MRPQSTASTVGGLLDEGLVARGTHPTDGRKTPLTLTDAGRRILERERDRRADWLARAIDDTLDEAERRTLAEAV